MSVSSQSCPSAPASVGAMWLGAVVSCVSASVFAQSPPSGGRADVRSAPVETVIVTAQKQAERLQDVPVPMTAIAADALVETSQLRVQDYYDSIPGLGLTLAGNGGEPVIVIRGITTGGDTNPTVGIVVDEVAYGASVSTGMATPPVADIDPGDLAHVEVLRGPQGTLYGASSIGGLLKFVTVDPSMERFSGRLQVGATSVRYGDDLGHSVRGSFNIPVSDTFAVRASGFTGREPGYVDNAETGQRDVNYRDNDGGRLSALWQPSEDFSLKLSAFIQNTERGGTEDIDTLRGRNPQQSFLRGSGNYSRDTEAYAATMKARLGDVELVSATGYSVDEWGDTLDLTTYLGGFLAGFAQTFYGVDRVVATTHNNTDKFTQEFRATIPLGSRVNWLVGAFYTDEKTFRTVDNRAAISATNTVGSLFNNVYDSTFEEYAAFTNFTFQLTDRFDLQVGGRYGKNEQVVPLTLTGALAELFFGSDPYYSPELRSEDSAVTYLITPRFKISPDLMVYARMASGYRPGGANGNCGFPDVPCSYDPDTTQNYDIGVKGSAFGNAVSFDASVYYIDWKDIQISGIFTPGGFFTYTGNVSRARSQGVELSLDTNPTQGLTVSAWGAYNDAELTEGLPAGQNFVANDGDRLPFSSRLSGSVSAEQEFSLSSTTTAFIGASATYVGERTGNFQRTTLRQKYPSYTKIDVRTGLRYDSWALNLFVTNLTDRRGVLRTGLDAAFVPTFATYVRPRTVGLTFEKTF